MNIIIYNIYNQIILKNIKFFLHSEHYFYSSFFLSILHNKHLSKYYFSYISSKKPLSSNSYNLSPSPIYILSININGNSYPYSLNA